MNTAQELINAIQSLKPGLLRIVIARVQRQAGFDLSSLEPAARHRIRGNPINARLEGVMDLTALHVAAKAYSAYRNSHLAPIFNEMVAMLLEAGANPWLEAGKATDSRFEPQGLTVAQVCERHIPPALAAFLEAHCDDNRTSKQDANLIRLHPTTVARNQKRLEAFRKRNPKVKVTDADELDRLEQEEDERDEIAA